MSESIVPYLKDGAFDSEITRAMGEAYDLVRKSLHDKGQPGVVQDTIARRIIEIARRALIAMGAGHVVLKLGAEGALSVDRDGSAVRRPGIAVEAVVDPVGAGDAFCAGYIAGRLDGLDEAACLDLGNACGAAVLGAEGDVTGAPTRLEAERLRTTSAQESVR